MDAATRLAVRARAKGSCEYCHIHEDASVLSHHVEHIVARQHGGSDEPANLALACHHCNEFKGPNLTGIDPESHEITRLFDPRRDVWSEHFRTDDGAIHGLTSVGRTTVQLLRMNESDRVEIRKES